MSPRLASLLKTVQPGGVILFARNIKSAAQTHRLLRECQKCVSAPLFACVDLEGGTVDRFRELLGPDAVCGGGFFYWRPPAFSQTRAGDRRELPGARV